MQGGTFAFITPTFAILSLPEWKCPDDPVGEFHCSFLTCETINVAREKVAPLFLYSVVCA